MNEHVHNNIIYMHAHVHVTLTMVPSWIECVIVFLIFDLIVCINTSVYTQSGVCIHLLMFLNTYQHPKGVLEHSGVWQHPNIWQAGCEVTPLFLLCSLVPIDVTCWPPPLPHRDEGDLYTFYAMQFSELGTFLVTNDMQGYYWTFLGTVNIGDTGYLSRASVNGTRLVLVLIL